MDDFKIMTDTSADLNESYCKKYDIDVLSFPYSIDGVEYNDAEDFSAGDFYRLMREGHITKTSQISAETLTEAFSAYLEKGTDVLYVSLSSGLSGTYDGAVIVKEKLEAKFPGRRVVVIDGRGATLGQGLLVLRLAQMKKRGVPITTLESWALENRLKIVHLFTVGDLMYLHRGGRLSKTSAVAGSILGIKPVLHVDDDGKLQLLKKVRGRKQSLIAMVDLMEEKIKGWENEEIVIAHGDCLDDAKFLAHEIKKRLGIQNVMFSYIGMVIGSHSGPGTIMLGFMGEPR